jgi:hypothetical protein
MNRLKRSLTIAVLFLAVAVVLTACGSKPSIVVEPIGLELGDIPATEMVQGTLRVRNEGQGELYIDSLRTSCGCTGALVRKENLAPGEETDLVITFDPQAHPGLYGSLLRVVYLESNDPETPELEIPINVHVLAPEEATQ